MDSVTPTRQQTIVPARTRFQFLAQLRTRIGSLGLEPALILTLIVIALVAQGLNMFNYPSFTLKDDEGIYASQAWAVLREGKLTYYTYFYDHAPAGWILMAAWMGLTGGVHTFGLSIDSGRILMLLLHLASVPLLYQVARKLGSNIALAALATFLFSVSPLAVFYQRMVLLDNIMIFWALLSLNLLLDGWGRLSRLVLSGVCFGLAILTKETAIFLLPAMLFLAWQQRWKHQGRFAIAGWLLPVLMVGSFYPLYALLKGELLPTDGSTGSLLGASTGNGVSLLDALKWQATRTTGASTFLDLVGQDWLQRDAALFIGGIVASALNLLRVFLRDRRAFATGLLGLLPVVYLARGGIVFDYYIIFAVPFFCLNLAVLLSGLTKLLHFPRLATGGLSLGLAGGLLGLYLGTGVIQPLYTAQPDVAGREAISWIKQNVPADSMMIIRDDMWTDLHEPGMGGPAFPNAHSHWKVAQDPAVKNGIFKDDWHNVDYLVMSGGLKEAFKQTNNTVALDALNHAHLVKRWEAPKGNEALHPQQIIELWKVDKPGRTDTSLLQGSNSYIQEQFDQRGAYTGSDGSVTAESQSYALLRSVWTGDRTGFYQAWNWTKTHLLNKAGLLEWQWKDGQIINSNVASDVNSDTALALLMASKRWNDPELLNVGRSMAQAIWDNGVVDVNNRPYITAGDWAIKTPVLALNPGYFAPYAYRVFKEVDPSHNWQGVIDSGYEVLFNAAKSTLGAKQSSGLPPDWIGLNRANGQLVPLQLSNTNSTQYGYDAARTYWRVALDLKWSQDGRASAFLKQAGFLRDEVNQLLQDGITHKNLVSSVYKHDGTVVQEAPTLSGTTGAIAALQTLDPASANVLYASQVVGLANHGDSTVWWGNPSDLKTQEWGWFATAFYTDSLPNLWQGTNR
ncbi:MAG TPA: glycosyl hydrolase family 8 [Chloroflexia bacterium]|nr:glycosyl hydrolase family 8 [Chloroflexia bacterium]